MVLTFAPQLYQLAPPGVAAASLAAAEGSGASLATSLGRLLWLLWYSQALIMALNGGGPLTNTFRHFLQASSPRGEGWVGGGGLDAPAAPPHALPSARSSG